MSEPCDIAYISTLDLDRLTPIIRQALDDDGATVVSWDVEPLTGGHSRMATVRVGGEATIEGQSLPWSVFLKQIMAPKQYKSGKDGDGWRREILLYEEHVFDDLSTGLQPPRCYLIDRMSGGEYWLWCEFIDGVHGKDWPRSRFHEAARHVGQLNGAYLAGEALPTGRRLPHPKGSSAVPRGRWRNQG